MFFSPEPPSSALAGVSKRRCRIQLRRTSQAHSPGAILTAPDAFLTWVDGASSARLEALRFALCRDRRVLVIGQPLPPVRGQEYTLHRQVLLPAGYEFSPPALRHLVPGMLHLEDGDVALFSPDGSAEHIPAAALVPATRSAVRMTMKEDPAWT